MHLFKAWPFRQRVLCLIVTTQFLAYAALGLLTHAHFRSAGFDLGIFDQAVWHYSQFQSPASTIRGLDNILGDHFHPILVLLAPLYWIYPHAQTLIWAQSALLASSTIPVYLFCRNKLGDSSALLLAAAYSLNIGLQYAAAFDFHEIAFAVPAIAWMLWAIEIRRWNLYYFAAVILLASKEDQALLVVFFGIYLLLRRYWLPGLLSIVAGAGWFIIAIKLLIPHFSGGLGYGHWNYARIGSGPLEVIRTILVHPLHVLGILIDNPIKRATLHSLSYPFFGLFILSPVVILAIPLVSERMLSDVPNYWTKLFHYSATIAPILACATAEGIFNLKRIAITRVNFPVRSGMKAVFALCVIILAANLYLSRHAPFGYLLADPGFYRMTSYERTGNEAVSHVPKTASVTTLNGIASHLSDRQHITLLPDNSAEYVVVGPNVNYIPLTSRREVDDYLVQRQQAGGSIIFNQDGWTVLRIDSHKPF